jgi:hypothetical protein
MGACCNGKETKGDRIEEEIYTKNSRSYILSEHTKTVIPKIELDVEKSNLNKLLTNMIIKYSGSFDNNSAHSQHYMYNVQIKKFCMEQLWNVCKFYLDDFTASDYILLDLRDKVKKKENYLKKFKIINYSLDEMKMMNESNLVKFKRYLDFKSVIIVQNDDNIKTCEEIIEFMASKKINCKFYLFDHNLNEIEMTQNNKFLYETLEMRKFKNYPFIMLSLRFFPHLKSENFVFFDFIKEENESSNSSTCSNKFNYEFLTNKKHKESPIHSFYNFFNSSTILQLKKIENKEDNLNGALLTDVKFKTDMNPIINSSICKMINLSGINSLQDILIKKDEINSAIDILKIEILNRKSVFIQIEENFNLESVVGLIFLIVWKITDILPRKIQNYILEHFIFIKDLRSYCQNNFNKIEEFLIENFGQPEIISNNYEMVKDTTNLDELKFNKEKVFL